MMQRILFVFFAIFSSALAFVPSTTQYATTATSPLKAAPLPTADIFTATATESSSNLVSVATLDPTTMLSDTLGGLLGSSLILAVPIIAALAIVGIIAFAIVSYANPADEDD